MTRLYPNYRLCKTGHKVKADFQYELEKKGWFIWWPTYIYIWAATDDEAKDKAVVHMKARDKFIYV